MIRAASASIVAILVVAPAAQEPPRASPAQPFGTSVSAVVVDAVVRDSKGRPVTGLQKQDFRLLEDGVLQQIGAISAAGALDRRSTDRSAVTGTPPHPPAGTTPSPLTSAAPAGPQFLALVFDRLSPDARPLAAKGALACLETLREQDYVAVYSTDPTMTTIQTYTNDRTRLRRAIDRVARRAGTAFDREQERDARGNPLPGDANPDVPVVASAESVGRPVDGRTSIGRLMNAVGAKTHASWEAMARDQQGYATTNALLAITSALGTLPGRKSVVFFAEGLAIPDAVLPHFRNVVTDANRGNVSIYTIDIGGLRVHSKDAEIAREVVGMGLRGVTVTEDGSNLSSLGMMERNEDVLRKDPRTSLSLLAVPTGGFLVENTNDLAKGFRQIDDDRRFHYLLTYTPSNPNFDGKWRTIAVSVPDRKVTVRARTGYLAVPGSSPLPLLAYEGPALAALTRSPAPAEIPIRAGAFVFPSAGSARLGVLASTDASALRFAPDASGTAFRTDFTIVARILDSRGETVKKSSQPYRLTGPIGTVDQARAGEVLFFRQPELEPGAYTLEVAVHDALAQRAGVHRSSFSVPDSRQLPQVGSLVVVRRIERVPVNERQSDNPLYVGDALVYPNLGEPLRLTRDRAIELMITLVADTGPPPAASLQIMREGQTLSRVPVALPPEEQSGQIRHLTQLPLETLSAGRYTLRLTVEQGGRATIREAAFTLVDR